MHVYKGECRYCDGTLIECFRGRWSEDRFPAGCSDCDEAETMISYVGEMSEETFKDVRGQEICR